MWGDRIVWGDTAGLTFEDSESLVFDERLVWGARIVWGDRIVWGERLVWGDRIMWGDLADALGTTNADSVWGNLNP